MAAKITWKKKYNKKKKNNKKTLISLYKHSTYNMSNTITIAYINLTIRLFQKKLKGQKKIISTKKKNEHSQKIQKEIKKKDPEQEISFN